MRSLIILTILLLIIPTALAMDLSEYPDFLFEEDEFDAKIVVGKDAPTMDITSAINLIPALQAKTEERIRGSTLDSSVDEIDDENIISIGNACDNKVTARILGVQTACATYFERGEAYIYLFKNKESIWMIVAGGTSKDTATATEVLGKYNEYELSGNAIKITGDVHPYTVSSIVLPEIDDEVLVEAEEEPEVVEEPEEEPVAPVEDDRNRVLAKKVDELVEEEEVPEIEPYVEDESYKEEVSEEAPVHEKVWIHFKNWIRWFFR